MRIYLGICSILLLNKFSVAQVAINPEKVQRQIHEIASSISVERIKKNVYYLASEKLEGRVMGSHGDSLAASFVAKCFKQNWLTAPYKKGKSYYQAVTIFRKDLKKASFFINKKKYPNYYGWWFNLTTTDRIKQQNIPVVFAGYGIEHALYNDFKNIDVRGKAVILLRGQPKDIHDKYLLSGSTKPAIIPNYNKVLKEKGAAMILMYDDRFKENASRNSRFPAHHYHSQYEPNEDLPLLYLSEERVNEILAPSDKNLKTLEQEINKTLHSQSFNVNNNISLHIQYNLKKEIAPNVIGLIRGTDNSAEAVILSAHHDHLGKDGKEIYYGATDNASGTAALMEIATLMNIAVRQGLKPKRTMIFASFTGEEKGLLGSYYFAENPVFPTKKIWGILNLDQLGRVDSFYSGKRADSNYAYVLVVDSLNNGLRKSLYSANEILGKLHLDTYYEQPQLRLKRIWGSDQFPFYLKGVPFIRIDCGFSKDYHKPTDTPDKLNYQLLSDQIQLAFLTFWDIANN